MNAESKQTQDSIVTPHQPNGKLAIVGHLAVLKRISKQLGDALFTASDGEDHSKSHRILMPAFSPRSLSSLVDITLLKTDILLDRFESSRKKPFEIGHAFTSLTFDIIGNFIGGNGLDFKTTENPERMSTEPFLHSMDIALSTKYIHDNIDGGKLTNRKVYKINEDANKFLWDYATNVINVRLDG